MSNDFYNPTGWPGTGVAGASAPGRAELAAVGTGFDKLPPLTAHPSEFVVVNPGATSLTSVTAATVLSTIGAQPLDAELTAIAGLTSAADLGIQFTGVGTAATYSLTTAGKALLDDASSTVQRATLGSTSVGDALFITASAAAARTTLGSTATGDAVFIAANTAAARTALGSTATGDAVFIAANAAAARTAIGAVIGTNVQAWDADLDAVAALAATAGMISRTGAGTFAVRTVTGTANEITITNGDGAAGAPTASLPAALTFTGKTVTGGTFASPAVSGTMTGGTYTGTVTGTLTNPANTVQALTDAASVAWDMSLGATATLLATGAVGATRAVAAPTNIKAGGRYVLHFTEDATGGRALTWNAVFKGHGGQSMASVVPVPTANATSTFMFESPDGTNLNVIWSRIGNVQVFTGSGTYTPTAGMRFCEATTVGGGGGSGGSGATSGGTGAAGGGGAGGGMAVKTITAATIGASQTVTIGAGGLAGATGSAGGTGGTTSLGAIVSATGGTGGSGSSSQSGPAPGGVGGQTPGTGSTGDYNTTGQGGGFGFVVPSIGSGGIGGSSQLGGGAAAVTTAGSSPGLVGGNYGGGASGSALGQSQAATVGSAGAPGIVIVKEFF